MDKLGSSSNNKASGNQNEDYLDKGAFTSTTPPYSLPQKLILCSIIGLDAAEKKWGGSMGEDTQKHRAVNEKIVRPPTKPYLYLQC